MKDDQMNSEGSSTAYSGINSSPVRFGSKASTSMRTDPIIVPHSTSAIGVKCKLESSFRAPVNKVPKKPWNYNYDETQTGYNGYENIAGDC